MVDAVMASVSFSSSLTNACRIPGMLMEFRRRLSILYYECSVGLVLAEKCVADFGRQWIGAQGNMGPNGKAKRKVTSDLGGISLTLCCAFHLPWKSGVSKSKGQNRYMLIRRDRTTQETCKYFSIVNVGYLFHHSFCLVFHLFC